MPSNVCVHIHFINISQIFSIAYIIEETMENSKYFVLFCVIIYIESLVICFLHKT